MPNLKSKQMRVVKGSACRMMLLGLSIFVLQDMSAQASQHQVEESTRGGSNAQLADPKLEARVDELLSKMTLEEKIGQLVQYDAGEEVPAAAENPAVNPVTRDRVDSMHLAETGMLGSMLNQIGAERTNRFQHAA